ncbi:MAG: hypothetical protein HY367_04470 [Candidatus Aenigmarchaeota archaeon]|nr:hypothetical protein [Candidatus Aenigmarchaeota archaeon]
MAEQLLKQLVKEVKSLRSEVREIKIAVNEIDEFQHREVRPEYAKRLKRIAEEKGKAFASTDELDKYLKQ